MLQSKKLLNFAHLNHGFTTKNEGDLNIRRLPQVRVKLAKLVDTRKENIVGFEQPHGRNLSLVTTNHKGKILPTVDGGVTKTNEIVLVVNTADCVPILFFEPKKKIVGAVHAGWRGIIAGIVEETVGTIVALSGKTQNLQVAIGPHINSCCYTVKRDRAHHFVQKFGRLPGMIYKGSGNYHLTLIIPLLEQLFKLGILSVNIDYFLSCTSCQRDQFFSYRRENSRTYGEMATFIQLIKG